jgi:hypothetical protein
MGEGHDKPTSTQPPINTTSSTTYASAVSATTRDQQRRNDVHNTEQTSVAEVIEKEDTFQQPKRNAVQSEPFKGLETKMHGNVFQLAEEGRKGNQFSLTMQALENYVSIEMEQDPDLSPLFETPPSEVTIPEPEDLPPMLSDMSGRVPIQHRLYIAWKFECENYNTRAQMLRYNLSKLFTVIISQCSPPVKTKIESVSGYDSAKSTSDCVWLVNNLRNVCHKFETTEYRINALLDAKAAIVNYRQGQYQSNSDYFDILKN